MPSRPAELLRPLIVASLYALGSLLSFEPAACNSLDQFVYG